MGYGGWLSWWVAWACGVGCAGPGLELPGATRQGGLELELEPVAGLSALPLNFRGRLRAAPPGEIWLFRGALSDYHDRALRQDELPQTLVERAVPLRFWREGTDCLLQPLVWLEPDAEYGLALTGHGRVATLRTAGEALPRAERFFPLGVAPAEAAVFCGAEFPEQLPGSTLEPGGISLRVTRGIFEVARQDCVTLVAERVPSEPALAPPSLAGVLLEPSAVAAPGPAVARAADCPLGELMAGACLEMQDDRVLLSSSGVSALWLLTEPRAVELSVSAFERRPLLENLVPGTSYELAGQVVLASGERISLAHGFSTAFERRHLVINEVLANAVAAEPESEWIEIVNDSSRRASLAGLWLEDGGGTVPLPGAELAPGELALLVSAGFRASALDVSLAPGVQLVVLPSLGARGLANSGEPLMLVGPEGILSRFPALAASKPGRSLARRAPATADDDAQGFALHGAPGASPGLPNSFE